MLKEFVQQYNPLHLYAKARNRARLKNHNFTILSSNCIGGLIYHELGEQFRSPTINIRMDSPDFIKFVSNIHFYLNQKLIFIDSPESYPVAQIGDLTIHFVHYQTDREAEDKWNERVRRINWDNIWILTNDSDGVTEEDIEILDSLDYPKGIAVFTKRDYPNYRFTYRMPLQRDGSMINVLKVNKIRGIREFEIYFDYVSWLNGEHQKDVNVWR